MGIFKRAAACLVGVVLVTSAVQATSAPASAGIDGTGETVVVDGPVTMRYALAYNPDRNEYLGIYQPQESATNGAVYALRFAADGTKIGDPVLVFALGSTNTQLLPGDRFDVTYNPTTKQYLVVGVRQMQISAGRSRGVIGRRLDALGVPIGAEQSIVPVLGNILFCVSTYPDVTYDPATSGYKLVYTRWWSTTSDGPGASCGAALTPDQSIPVVQALTSTLGVGASVDVGAPIAGPQAASIASNPSTNDVMVSRIDTSTTGSVWIYSSALGLETMSTIVDDQGASRGFFARPEPVVDPMTGNYLVTAQRTSGLSTTTVFDSAGARLSGFRLSGPRVTATAAVGDGTYVAWGGGQISQIAGDGQQIATASVFQSIEMPVGIAANVGGAPSKFIVFGPASTTLEPAIAVRNIVERATLPLEPARILDTRSATGETIDGLFARGGQAAAGSITSVKVTSRAGVPADATAAVVTVTVVRPSAGGFATVFPCGQSVPNSSNLNYQAGDNVANSVVAKLSATGTICVFSERATDLLIDVNGYVPAGGSITPLVPARLLDTRTTAAAATIDGSFLGGGPRPAKSELALGVTNRGGVPLDAGIVLLNVTAVRPATNSFVTVYSCDDDQPLASNLNAPAGGVAPNLVLASVSAAGTVCIYTNGASHLVADVVAYGGANSGLRPIVPARLFESRPGENTVDGQGQTSTRVRAGGTVVLDVRNRGGVPGNATGAVLNLTAIRPAGRGFLTAYPCGSTQPNSSNLNFVAGQVIANFASIKLGTSGRVCIFSSADTDLVVDVDGYVVD